MNSGVIQVLISNTLKMNTKISLGCDCAETVCNHILQVLWNKADLFNCKMEQLVIDEQNWKFCRSGKLSLEAEQVFFFQACFTMYKLFEWLLKILNAVSVSALQDDLPAPSRTTLKGDSK